MPTGPNLEQISAGQPLVAGKIARNFASIQAFLASIPNDNLLSQYAQYEMLSGTIATLAASTTGNFGNQFVQASSPVTIVTVDVEAYMANTIVSDANGFVLSLEFSDLQPGPSAIWQPAGVSLTFTAADATAGALGGNVYFKTFDVSATPVIAQRWVRWTLAAGNVDITRLLVKAACKARLTQ